MTTPISAVTSATTGIAFSDVEHFVARMPSDSTPSALELQRQHAHADQVGAVDALEAARDHRLHAEQLRALGRPVARRSGAVLLAAEHHGRRALGDVAHRGVVDRHLSPEGWNSVRPPSLAVRPEAASGS
jgi:hypothetical protein